MQFYRCEDLKAITANRWVKMQFKYEGQGAPEDRLHVEGKAVRIEKTLVVTYKKGKAYLVENLIVINDDGAEDTIQFTLTDDLSTRGM